MVERNPGSSNIPLMYGGILPQEEMLEIGKKQKKLIIGIPKEDLKVEKRLPLTPEAVEVLINNGHEVLIETKAGEGANYSDSDYSERGGMIVDSCKEVYKADIILKIAPIDVKDINHMKGNQVIFTSLQVNAQTEEYIRKLMSKKITAIAFEHIKDQFDCFPVLQSMNAIAGNVAITIAAELLSNVNLGKGILLGGISGITPTEVVIIGAGTAAESAARAALGFGAFVKVFDTSVHNLELLQRNLGVRLHTSIFHPQVLKRTLKSADVLIGAINLFEKRHQYFVTEEMVKIMKKRSVIIDLSVDQGGCIETSEQRTLINPVYEKHGVIHFSVANTPSRVARTASIALSNIVSPIMVNISNSGGPDSFLKANRGVRNGIYLYNGILTNDYIGGLYDIPSKDINLLMAAF